MAQQPFKRTRIIVDPAYQMRFVTRMFAVILSVGVVSSVIACGIIWISLRVGGSSQYMTSLIMALCAVGATLLLEIIIAVPVVYILGIRQSHRIIGPIQRMQRALSAIGEGDFSQRLHLRDGDVLIEVAESINSMAEALEKQRNQ